MTTTARSGAAVIAVAVAVALGIWAVARLLGVDLTVGKGPDPRQVGPVEVLVTTVLAGLLAWAAYWLLARTPRTARWWPFVGSAAIAVSLTGPNYLADGIAAVVLIAMHVAVGAVLIWGFATQRRWSPNQSRTLS